MPELAIVIPTLERPHSLPRALEALARSAEGLDVEVAVVSGRQEQEPERAAAALEASGLAGVHLQCPVAGASASRNAGVAATRSPLILFTDDDLLASPGMVSAHLEFHRANPDASKGVLGAVEWAEEVKVSPFMRWVERGVQFDFGSIDGVRAGWGHFYTCNVSLKRSIFERVGGFDSERFPFFYEDLDLGLRLDREGFELVYEPRAHAGHLHEMAVEDWIGRAPALAAAERRFCDLHPEAVPYFHDLFAEALEHRPARGRSERLARLVGPGMPLIGPRLWQIVDLYYRQQVAPAYLEGWAAEGRDAA